MNGGWRSFFASINCPDVGPGVKVSAGNTAKAVKVAAGEVPAVCDSSNTNRQDSGLGMRNGFVSKQVVLQFVIHGGVTSANPLQHHRGVFFFLIPVVCEDGT